MPAARDSIEPPIPKIPAANRISVSLVTHPAMNNAIVNIQFISSSSLQFVDKNMLVVKAHFFSLIIININFFYSRLNKNKKWVFDQNYQKVLKKAQK